MARQVYDLIFIGHTLWPAHHGRVSNLQTQEASRSHMKNSHHNGIVSYHCLVALHAGVLRCIRSGVLAET